MLHNYVNMRLACIYADIQLQLDYINMQHIFSRMFTELFEFISHDDIHVVISHVN